MQFNALLVIDVHVLLLSDGEMRVIVEVSDFRAQCQVLRKGEADVRDVSTGLSELEFAVHFPSLPIE